MMTFPKQQHTTLFIFYTLLYIISYINTPSPAPGGGIPPYQATHVKMTRESKDEAVKQPAVSADTKKRTVIFDFFY